MIAARPRFADNPHYVQYERLLKQLHDLIASGRGDSDEAGALREEMEGPGQGLTRVEVARLNLLSADLYALRGQEHYSRGPGADLTPEARRKWVEEAAILRDWDEVLRRLRSGPVAIAPDVVAYMRARAYANLGHLDTAISFIRQALERNSQHAGYALLLTEWLAEADPRLKPTERGNEETPVEARGHATSLSLRP